MFGNVLTGLIKDWVGVMIPQGTPDDPLHPFGLQMLFCIMSEYFNNVITLILVGNTFLELIFIIYILTFHILHIQIVLILFPLNVCISMDAQQPMYIHLYLGSSQNYLIVKNNNILYHVKYATLGKEKVRIPSVKRE